MERGNSIKKLVLVIFVSLIFLGGFVVYQRARFFDNRLHVVFCDVGQGDAILTTKNGVQFLIDGGLDSSVLSCLSSHMPFWDRKIEIVLVTHPDADHYGGIVDVVRRYNVDVFVSSGLDGESQGWETLVRQVKNKGIKEKIVAKNDRIRYGNIFFDVIHPAKNFVGTQRNEYSIVGVLSYGVFDMLLTGDITPPAIDTAVDDILDVEVLKVPHHGSKNGLVDAFLEKASPEIAVISVGKNNSYGHPHKEILTLLQRYNIRILRTDEQGAIEVVSDGKTFSVF